MLSHSLGLLAAAFVTGTVGTEVGDAFLRQAASRGWQVESQLKSDDYFELTLAVRQQNLDVLDQLFHNVSNPANAKYGKHLSFDEVNMLTEPRSEHRAVVDEILRELGAVSVRRTVNGDFVVAKVRAESAEHVFGGTFLRFRHSDGRQVVRNPDGVLPQSLASAVDFVLPLGQQISQGGVPRLQVAKDVTPNSMNTPASLRALYGVDDAEGSSSSNKQAVTAFLEQWYTDEALQQFFSTYYTRASGRKVSKVVGDGEFMFPGVEAELDVQYIMSMGGNIETEFWSFSGHAPDAPENEPFLKFLYTLGNTSDAPLVISTSYGEPEATVDEEYAKRCNVEFQKAGTRGISLIFSSGDGGVGGDGFPGTCGSECEAGSDCYVSMWPAASPYVTTVGGTTLRNENEVGADLSGGGFSYRFPVPDWQRDAVDTFLESQTNRDHFSKSGRGFPDISAQAVSFEIIMSGSSETVTGTSAAAPTVAGIFSLLNDARLKSGKSPLGFLNYFIYQNPDAFTDMTSGCNPGCDQDGFCAVPHWDAVTGLGTPNYPKLLSLMGSADVVV